MEQDVEQLIAAAEAEWQAAWARGPVRTRWTSLPVQAGDPAPDASLPDHEGVERRLSELWSDGPLLLLFWRHFGCSCGMDRAKRLVAELPDIEAGGGRAVIVGQGEPARSARYRGQQGLTVPILSDPDRALYEAYGLLQGTPAQVLFDAPDEFLRCELDAGMALSAGRHGTPRAAVDDPWQLPGEFVIDRGGVIRSIHRYGWCEDYPDPRVALAEIRRAAGRL